MGYYLPSFNKWKNSLYTRMPVSKNLANVFGWQTNRRLIVLESDDWGSIRMPSKKAFESMTKAGIDLKSDSGAIYNKYDTLASQMDLELLFEVLSSVKDSAGKMAVMTPVSVVANPDFEKISKHNFSKYFYEPFTETLNRYKGCENSFKLWKQGIESRLFCPQFHGREHLNVKVWMEALKNKHKNTYEAFKCEMWGIPTGNDPEINIEFQAAFDFNNPDHLKYHKEVIISGLALFEKLFGYKATYFVPPNGLFNSNLESVCLMNGIKFLSTSRLLSEKTEDGRFRKKLRWNGKRSKVGMRYIIRNCFFEPSQTGQDEVDNCLSQVANAFKWNKPAIISSHRINYIGSLYKYNRNDGLRQLRLLLEKIINKWPDVEFVTTKELGDLISNEK